MTASDVLVESLIDWGVDVVFRLPGDGINGFVDAFGPTAIASAMFTTVRRDSRHGATGYANFTGKLGVCF